MRCEVHNKQPPAGIENAQRFAQRGQGIIQIVQDLMEQHHFKALFQKRQPVDIAEAQLAVWSVFETIARDTQHFLADIHAKSHADIDEWQTQMQLRSTKVGRVHLYTDGLTAKDAAITGVRRAESVESAVAESIERHGDPEVAFIPEGPYVVPVRGAA